VYLRSNISRKLFCSSVETGIWDGKLPGLYDPKFSLSGDRLESGTRGNFEAASSLRDRQLASSVTDWLFVNQTKEISRRLKRPCLSWEPVEVILLVATEATAEEGEVAQE
jgi:hypothetical protein